MRGLLKDSTRFRQPSLTFSSLFRDLFRSFFGGRFGFLARFLGHLFALFSPLGGRFAGLWSGFGGLLGGFGWLLARQLGSLPSDLLGVRGRYGHLGFHGSDGSQDPVN